LPVVLLLQLLLEGEPLAADPVGLVFLAALGRHLDGLVLVGDLGRLDLTLVDQLDDLRRVRLRVRASGVRQVEQHDHDQDRRGEQPDHAE